MRKIALPTGFIIVDEYANGELETLSIGDYGKSRNIKAPFLSRHSDIEGVPNGPVLPLQDKWVITMSTQYGCPMRCTFCDVPNIKYMGNVIHGDFIKQLRAARNCFPDVKYTDRLNIHFARMGEPSFNHHVFTFASVLAHQKAWLQQLLDLRVEVIHPVFTSMCPIGRKTEDALLRWAQMKNNDFNGQAGLQLSINSTSEEQREEMFGGMALSLDEIAVIGKKLPDPVGRKYCLNFAWASGNECDGDRLQYLFDPDKFMVKITPIHNNNACRANGIETLDGYESFEPYREPEQAFANAGFDTIVFVPSQDEEDGCITCGNAILGGSELKIDTEEVTV